MSARTAWLLATSLALLVLAAGFAQARPRPDEKSGPPPSAILTGAALVLVSFDADGDYATSRAELDAGLVRETGHAFGPASSLSPIGFEAWSGRALGGPSLGPFRLAFDGNVDGQITRTEFADAFVELFDRLDKNRDGRIVRGELVERLPQMRPGEGPGGRRPPMGGPPGGGGAGGPGGGRPSMGGPGLHGDGN